MPFKIGQEVVYKGSKVVILEVRKGRKTNIAVYQNGILPVGFKSNPPIYRIEENLWVRGNKLSKQ